jgi:hypothetical protein
MPNWTPRPARPFDYAAASAYANACTTGARELSRVAQRRAAALLTARDEWRGAHRLRSDELEGRLAQAWGDVVSAVLREAARAHRAIEEARAYDHARAQEEQRWQEERSRERPFDPRDLFPRLDLDEAPRRGSA